MTANYDDDDQQVRRSHRRAGGPSRTSPSADHHGSTSSRRRPPTSSAISSRSLDSNDSGNGGDAGRSSRNSSSASSADARASSRRENRRAPTSGGPGAPPRRSRSEDLNDFDSFQTEEDLGYGDAAPDMGYGDALPDTANVPGGGGGDKQVPARSRRQRRCSIAEVTSSSIHDTVSASEGAGSGETDYGYGAPAPERPRLQRNSSGEFCTIGGSTNTISNIAIPMTDQDAPKRKNRRGSMFGAISRNVIPSNAKEPEQPDKTKKPGADRDRRRQGTLLDRVGAGADARGGRSGPSASYSDRIVSK